MWTIRRRSLSETSLRASSLATLCELFPRQAAIADKFSIVRSLNHDIGIHSDGGIIVLTGKRPSVLHPTSQSKSEHPDFGSIASRLRGTSAIPPYVAVPGQPYMTRPTYLGIDTTRSFLDHSGRPIAILSDGRPIAELL